MKKLLFLLVPFALSAYQVDYSSQVNLPNQNTQTESSQGTQSYNTPTRTYTAPTTTTTTSSSSQPNQVYYRTTSPNNAGPAGTSQAPGTISNTSQNAWHNAPNKENYFDDPNWPNIKK